MRARRGDGRNSALDGVIWDDENDPARHGRVGRTITYRPHLVASTAQLEPGVDEAVDDARLVLKGVGVALHEPDVGAADAQRELRRPLELDATGLRAGLGEGPRSQHEPADEQSHDETGDGDRDEGADERGAAGSSS